MAEPGPTTGAITARRLSEARMHERAAEENARVEAELKARFEAINGPEPATVQRSTKRASFAAA